MIWQPRRLDSDRQRRPFLLSFALLSATLACGLLVRFVPLGLPRLVTKYGGSALWALLIYWLVSTVKPGWRIGSAALCAVSMSTAIELLKLYHAPDLDAFRLTLPGVLLLGRIFSLWDIVVYWLAIGLGAWIDRQMRRPIPG
ncbi:MAG: DUF2809 domain-containing protein [Janthinobacterium lividum]